MGAEENTKADQEQTAGMAQIIPSGGSQELTQENLDDMNIEGAREDNKKHLEELGGVEGIASRIDLNLKMGLTDAQVEVMRSKFGPNEFPEKPMTTFLQYFIESFNDLTLMILIAAAIVSLIIGSIEDPDKGWIEGCAILLAVFLVAIVTATNDYQKELQFRNLEKNSEGMERCSVIRNGSTVRINPSQLVVGDVVSLKSGDGIPADGVMFEGGGVKCNESALTGEPDDLKKDLKNDPFFLSSTVVTDTGTSGDAKVICVGIGKNSQWGKIKANLVVEEVNTPLQERLEEMVTLIGYGGAGSALLTFIALLAMIWLRHDGDDVLHYVIEAFIIAVTIIVVAIPEGLPLAVAISLSYSSRQMLMDGNLIRKLEACETMGNATNICTDKTGTLTENRMTVVEGFFAGKHIDQDAFAVYTPSDVVKGDFSLNSAVNGNVFLQDADEHGKAYHRPKVVGSATEGAMVLLLRKWGIDYASLRKEFFSSTRDMQFPFNSTKKRSTVIICDPNKVQLLCKGASEVILKDCTHYVDESGAAVALDSAKVDEITKMIEAMAGRALRTLAIAHKNYKDVSALPEDYKTNPPDGTDLVLDAIIGIIDPLRSDVKEAVATAQGAGVMVRMVTGDNIITARAIAKQCGILTAESGVTLTKEMFDKMSEKELMEILPNVSAIEGPAYRKLTPAQADILLQRVQVMARSSPNDKFLMVKRLNGNNLPANKAEWELEHPGFSWEADRDKILPGYQEEWQAANPKGGQVVGVTGDGTNDAPALKASDVGLSMGITGTKVAQNASDIVITDDKFSSIVKAILWGRSVYDNIRRFLQFQLTVNVVALLLVFIGSVAGFPPPLNAVMMLWVNLIMDTLGALALGTEKPTADLLQRKPYLKSAPLVSIPMIRNILFQSVYQLALLFILLFSGVSLFGNEFLSGDQCLNLNVKSGSGNTTYAFPSTFMANNPMINGVGQYPNYKGVCDDFLRFCGSSDNGECYVDSGWDDLTDFSKECIENCAKTDFDYTHYTLIFNVFVWCQIFNEFNARQIKNNPAIFTNIAKNQMFMFVIITTILMQLFIVELGGDWVRTKSIKATYWLWSMVLGAGSLPVGVLMRIVPFAREESADDFFGYDMPK